MLCQCWKVKDLRELCLYWVQNQSLLRFCYLFVKVTLMLVTLGNMKFDNKNLLFFLVWVQFQAGGHISGEWEVRMVCEIRITDAQTCVTSY